MTLNYGIGTLTTSIYYLPVGFKGITEPFLGYCVPFTIFIVLGLMNNLLIMVTNTSYIIVNASIV